MFPDVRVLLCVVATPLVACTLVARPARAADLVDLSLEQLMDEPIEALAKRVNVRERSDSIPPVLAYTEEFFQRFEPLSVGEMLKRTPGVTFASDVGEYAEPSLRGLGPQYTQVLIDGRRIAGARNDRTVLVDRIPAELVDRVEIIRSPTADMDSQGVGGALNIILKDGAGYEGGIYRAGGYYVDGEPRPSTFLSYGNAAETMRWGASLNYQERYNHKDVFAVERAAGAAAFTTKIEPDERETRDLALTSDLTFALSNGRQLSLDALFIDTDRGESQFERAFDVAENDGELEREASQSNQAESLQERTWLLAVAFTAPLGQGRSYELSSSYDRTEADSRKADYTVELEAFDFDAVGLTELEDVGRFLASHSDRALNDVFRRSSTALGGEINRFDNLDELQEEHVRDEEAKAGGRFTWAYNDSALSVGLDYVAKARTYESRIAAPDDGQLVLSERAYSAFDADEDRLSGYAQWSARSGAVGAEIGMRAEHTRLGIVSTLAQPVADAAVARSALGFAGGDRVRERRSDVDLNPAAHVRWDVSERWVLRLGAASTMRRPAFDELNPTLLLDDDDSVLGNPDLRPERALGFDAGADVTLDAEDAILGFNAFYRRIEDKIELNGADDAVNALLQAEIDEDVEAAQYVNNPHDGFVYGAELDLSYPLAALNAPNFHVFANYTYMHSRIRDASAAFPVERPFALQPDYHYNAGFDHLIMSWRLTWGASYQKRGAAQEWNYASGGAREVVDVRFGGNLEAFIEKTFADRFVVRVAAQNLLDAVRSDVARVYETQDDYRRGAPISAELDREESDPWVLVTFRGTF